MKKFGVIVFIVSMLVFIRVTAFAGTFTDSATGLTWDQTTAGPMTWQAALEYCENYSLGGYTDWRLPDITELQSLVDYSSYNPASSVSGTQAVFYWSSTTYGGSSAWGVNFKDGYITYNPKTGTNYFRAVRGGNPKPLCTVEAGNGDGTATDLTTGLIWQAETKGPMTWQEALNYCKTLTLAGMSDWRLPDITELQSFINYDEYDPAISNYGCYRYGPFKDTVMVSDFYWSSTTYGGSSAWGVNFKDGYITYNTKTGTNYFRAVRGGNPKPLCTVEAGNGDGTATDPATGLIWQAETKGPMTWQEALNYCKTLTLAGMSDWRLPDITELQSFINYDEYDPAISNYGCYRYGPFKDTVMVSDFYWSSTTYGGSSAWGVNFKDGYITYNTKTGTYYFRAVRGGNPKPLCSVEAGNGDGTATDPSTGLIWQAETKGPMTWQEALNYCKTLTLAGMSDWRLPDITELQSFINYDEYDPAISNYGCYRYGPFKDTVMVSDFYWSSTTYGGSSAWGVNFRNGYITYNTKTGKYYVKAVRSAKPEYMTVSIGPVASGEAPFSFDLLANPIGVIMDRYEWYITGGDTPDMVTYDGYLSPTIFDQGDFTIRVVAYDMQDRAYEAEISVKVLPPSSINESVRFLPFYPAGDSIPSEVMKGGHAIRYYRLVNAQNVPITNKALYYKYADGTRFTTSIDDQGFAEIQTPAVNANQTLRIIVTNKDGNALGGITITGTPEFPVQATDRKFTEEYELLIGYGATFSVSGPKLSLGPVKFKTVEAGLHGEKNVSTTITLDTSGSNTDMEMENTLDMGLGVETFAGLSASILKEHIRTKGRPKLEAGVGLNAYVNTAMSTRHRFEDFFNSARPDHSVQLFTAATLFFENLIKLDPMFLNNIMTDMILKKLNETINDLYYLQTELSGSAKIQANLGAELSLKNPFGILPGSGAGIEINAFDGETVLTVTGGQDVNGGKSLELSVAADIDIGTFSAGFSQKFAGDKRRKDTPELKTDFIDKAWKRLEGELTIGAQIDPYNRWSLSFSMLTDRIGGDSYFFNSNFTENNFNMTISDNAVLDFMDRESDLIRQIREADDFQISNFAYLSAVQAFQSLSFGRAEWDESSKQIHLFSLPIGIGLGLGLGLDLSFNVDVKSVVEYTKTQGIFIPEKGMIKTAAYDRDAQINNQLKGITSVTDQYVAVIDGVIDSILETLEKIKDAGVELVVETGDAIVAGGAKIKAGATALVSGAKLKISKLIWGEKRSYRIATRDAAGISVAATVGNVFVVSAVDASGSLITGFTEALELTLGYTDADVTLAGFTTADAPKLKIYRWNSSAGYYEYIGGTVDTTTHSIFAMISKPGQYVLAIDQQSPQITDFRITPGTLTPDILFLVQDSLSGVNPAVFSVKLDGAEIVNSANYASYFNINTGVFDWKSPNPLSKGSHLVVVHSADTAGNVTDQTFSFTVNDVPPVITHTPVTACAAGAPLTINAAVSDDEGVQAVVLFYRAKTGELPYISVKMSDPTGTGAYIGTIPNAYLTSFGARYFIRAADISGNQTDTNPVDIVVSDASGPVIASSPTAYGDPKGVKLTWTSSSDSDTAGYKIFLGKTADTMTLFQDVGKTTWISLDETHNQEFISVSAYDSMGNEGVKTAPIKIEQCKAADLDCNGRIDLADALICLKLISGIPLEQAVTLMLDVNSDMKIGLEEAVYILQKVAQIR